MLTTAFTRVAVAAAAVVLFAASASQAGTQTTPAATGTPHVQETGAIPEKRPESPAATEATPSTPAENKPAETAKQPETAPATDATAATPSDSKSGEAGAVANAVTPTPPTDAKPADATTTPATAGSTPSTETAPAATTPEAKASPDAAAPATPPSGSAETATPPATAAPADANATAAAPTPPPAPPFDPVIAVVRTWLGTAANTSGANKDDAAAAVAFYGARTDGALWVDAQGFTAKGKSALDELKRADDWGLSADAFALPRFNVTAPSNEALAEGEARLTLELLKYVRFARGGRLNLASLSRILDLTPPIKDPNTVMTELASAPAVDAYLRDQHPKHEQFQLLHKALLKARGPAKDVVEEDPALQINLPATREMLKIGVEHPNIALLRQRMKVPAEGGVQETLFDEKLELALKAYQVERGLKATGELTGATRKALNAEGDVHRKPDPERGTQLLVLNMERWRWMPENMGRVYVWNNIPEYVTRTIKGDEVIFKERIIVGLPEWATPVFSETMKTIVFNPSWGMPDGIKTRELAPRLRAAGGGFLFFGGGGGGNIIRAYGLDVYRGGRKIDPDSVDWTNADVRAYSFIQPPGGKNPLGRVKFMFPNRHDVYMHDTIERSLFQQPSRALSHGCIRVQDPMRFAEVMLEEGNGLDERGVANAVARGGEVKLTHPIPVHNAYFTAVADKDGHVSTFADLYGHDSRLSAALTGRTIRFEAPSAAVAESSGAPAAAADSKQSKKKKYKAPDTLADAISGFWMN